MHLVTYVYIMCIVIYEVMCLASMSEVLIFAEYFCTYPLLNRLFLVQNLDHILKSTLLPNMMRFPFVQIALWTSFLHSPFSYCQSLLSLSSRLCQMVFIITKQSMQCYMFKVTICTYSLDITKRKCTENRFQVEWFIDLIRTDTHVYKGFSHIQNNNWW